MTLTEPDLPERDAFAFLVDEDGMVTAASGAARPSLVGLSFALAGRGGAELDGRALGAFRNRDVIVDARLRLAGNAPHCGEWFICAWPRFDPTSGVFLGYRGEGRRDPAPAADADTVRQLAHELRTPLNAIQGFGEMIGRQAAGPANSRYREAAERIVEEARGLTDTLSAMTAMAERPAA